MHAAILALGALVTGGVVVAAVAISNAVPEVTTAVVVRVVDGDTVDVRGEEGISRVRLLNVDAPETVDPSKSVECLGPEASARLHELLPEGTQVTLRHDVEPTDRYGRELAGVFVGDQFVNASLARSGLAAAVVVGENDRFYDAVLAAQEEARAEGIGLFADSVACTVPAQVAASEAATAAVIAAPIPADIGSIDAYAGNLAAAGATAGVVATLLDRPDGDRAFLGLSAALLTDLRDRAATNTHSIEQRTTEVSVARANEVARLEAERVEAERVEAERVAAVQAAEAQAAAAAEAQRVADAQRAADANRAAAKRPAARPAAPADPVAPAAPAEPAAPPASSGGGGDTYTGCRAYGPSGTSIDNKGRPYTKIDCVTKVPLG
ncbi:thermonuclease family protein [Cellulomonas sp. P5_C5]